MELIGTIVKVWRESGDSTLEPGATPEQLREAERAIGRALPEEFAALYRRCNGAYVLEGNIQLYPLEGDKLSVVQASQFLRSSDWPIPPELVVFGGNGGSELFGLWLPHDGGGRPLVVEVGAIHEDGSFAVTGTSLGRFLLGRTSYYLLLNEGPKTLIGSLALPARFSERDADDLDDEDYEALLRWADPDLPEPPVSSYDARLTADDLRRLAMVSG